MVRVEAVRGERVGCGGVVGEEAQSLHTAQGAGRRHQIGTRVKALQRVVVRMGVGGMWGSSKGRIRSLGTAHAVGASKRKCKRVQSNKGGALCLCAEAPDGELSAKMQGR
jgi:hypothetical protein